MNMVRKLVLKVFVIVILTFNANILLAQGSCEESLDPDCIDPYTVDIPIDGGVSALLIGGAIIGYKTLKRKKSDDNSDFI